VCSSDLPVALELPGEQPVERGTGRRGRLDCLEVAEQRDPNRADVVALGVDAANDVPREILAGMRLAGGVVAGVPALVDAAGLVDQEVVADVAVAAAD